jgi:hypothetical protein
MCMLLSGMRGNHLTRYPKPIGVYLDDFISALDLIEEQVSTISVPLSYSEELYALRLHIGMLRDELFKAKEANHRNLKLQP